MLPGKSSRMARRSERCIILRYGGMGKRVVHPKKTDYLEYGLKKRRSALCEYTPTTVSLEDNGARSGKDVGAVVDGAAHHVSQHFAETSPLHQAAAYEMNRLKSRAPRDRRAIDRGYATAKKGLRKC